MPKRSPCCAAMLTQRGIPKAWPSDAGRPTWRLALLWTVLEVCHGLGPAHLMSTKFTAFFKEGKKIRFIFKMDHDVFNFSFFFIFWK